MVKVREGLLTPELAKVLLASNARNRKIKPFHVKRLVKEIKAGRYRLNGETIKISKTGRLLDGQHRCMAVLECGIAIPVLFVEGLDEEVFSTIDSGTPRTGADVLGIEGHKHQNTLAAALGFVQRIIQGRIYDTGGVSNTEALALLKHYPGIERSVAIAQSVRRVPVPPSILAGLHYLFALVDRDAAEQFVHDLWLGSDLSPGDAVYQLRERMFQDKLSKSRLKRHEIAALVIKAWNARQLRRQTKFLRWRNGGDSPEPFPSIHGFDVALLAKIAAE